MKKSKRFGMSWLFILLALAILLFDNYVNFLIYMSVVALHEVAHYFVARNLGYKLSKFYLMPYGVCLDYSANVFSGKDEFFIAIAGPLVNVIFCVICVAVWWLFPATYYYLDYFCFCNLILALFNLLPCFPLDGGRVFVSLLSAKVKREKAIKITHVFNYLASVILIVMFVFSIFTSINYSYMFVAIFLFAGCVNPSKYSSYEHLGVSENKSKLYKKGCAVKIIAVASSVSIYKIIAKFASNKFNIVYVIWPNGMVRVLSEINIKNLAVKYSPVISLNEILLK